MRLLLEEALGPQRCESCAQQLFQRTVEDFVLYLQLLCAVVLH